MKYVEKRKIVSLDDLQQIITHYTDSNTIVFTNGCFDIIHRGHIYYLRESRKLGDLLIVGLNSDSSVKRLKGLERPFNRQEDRAFVLAALDFVDYIVIFDQDTPLDLIKIIKPDIYTKAGDYTLNNIIGPGLGSDCITSYGGKVELISFQKGYSSTNLINSLQEEIPMYNYENIQTNAIEALKEVLAQLSELKVENEISIKEGRDIVTTTDIFIETELIKKLRSIYPDHYFSSEEKGTATIEGEATDIFEWVIDPIDGTINYAAGLPWFSTSICLKHNDVLVVGIVYLHETGNIYSAVLGHGSFCNGRPIHVSQTQTLDNSILSFMLTSHYDESQTDYILGIVRNLSLKTRGLRLLVSQAYELCLIAEGKLDGTVCIKSKGFSSSAGSLIVQEAGGKVTTIDGTERTSKATSLLVSNGIIHDELVKVSNEH